MAATPGDYILFAGPGRVKRDTPLGSTVDDAVITPYIKVAQDREIHPVLGTQLYDKIRTLIADDDIGETTPVDYSDYKTLLDDYIIPCLSFYAFTELAYALRLRFSNNSIGIASSEVGQAASLSDIKPVVDRMESMASFYKERLIERLVHNQSLYPEYTTNQNEDMSPTTRNYFQGLNVDPKAPTRNSVKAILQGLGIEGNYR